MKSPNIVAMYRLKNEAKWIEKSLESISNLCSKIVILDDGSTDNTAEICRSFSNVVDIFQQKDLLPDEYRDRTKLLTMAVKQNPDYLLALEGNEFFMPKSIDILLEELNVIYPDSYIFKFQFLYMWDKFNQYRYDGFYENIWHTRLMSMKNQTKNLFFNSNRHDDDLHIDYLPSNILNSKHIIRSNVKILHYGNFDKKLRESKFKFYLENNPNSISQDDYQYIISGDGMLSGPHGMEFKLLPEDLCYKNL
jgi:glycosyltransferase involved in cell wall biosynthesis